MLKEIVTMVGRGIGVLSLSALFLTGCGGQDSAPAQDLPPAAQPMTEAVQSLVDQGNAAQREGRYDEALAIYQEAMELAPDHPVPQFGGLMAATAAGDVNLADSLRALLEASAPDLVAMLGAGNAMGGGQTMPANPHGGSEGVIPPVPTPTGSTDGALPPGHPTLIELLPDTAQPDTAGSR